MEGSTVQKFLFAAVFSLLSLLLLFVFSPFFGTLLWSLLFFVMINPPYVRILRMYPAEKPGYKIYKNLLAAVFALLTAALIVVPLFFIVKEAARQSFQIVKLVEHFVKTHRHYLIFLPDDPIVVTLKEITFNNLDLSKLDIPRQIISLLRESINSLLRASTVIARDLAGFVLTICFMVFTIFFLLVDGTYLLNLFIRAVPIQTGHIRVFITKFRETVRHLVIGYFFVALYQASAAFLIFFIFKIPGYLLLSIVLFFFAFIPMVGGAGIWIPVTVLKLLSGDTSGAILMGTLCLFFVSSVDNILRPFILQDMIKIHPLLIFFSILGSVSFFGFQGIILGPLILIFFFAALDIFLDLYQINKEEKDTQRRNPGHSGRGPPESLTGPGSFVICFV